MLLKRAPSITEAMTLGDRIAILQHGEIHQVGRPCMYIIIL